MMQYEVAWLRRDKAACLGPGLGPGSLVMEGMLSDLRVPGLAGAKGRAGWKEKEAQEIGNREDIDAVGMKRLQVKQDLAGVQAVRLVSR